MGRDLKTMLREVLFSLLKNGTVIKDENEINRFIELGDDLRLWWWFDGKIELCSICCINGVVFNLSREIETEHDMEKLIPILERWCSDDVEIRQKNATMGERRN